MAEGHNLAIVQLSSHLRAPCASRIPLQNDQYLSPVDVTHLEKNVVEKKPSSR